MTPMDATFFVSGTLYVLLAFWDGNLAGIIGAIVVGTLMLGKILGAT